MLEWLKSERDAAQERITFPVEVLDAKTRVNALRDDIKKALSARDGQRKKLRAQKLKTEGKSQAVKQGLRRDETELTGEFKARG